MSPIVIESMMDIRKSESAVARPWVAMPSNIVVMKITGCAKMYFFKWLTPCFIRITQSRDAVCGIEKYQIDFVLAMGFV